MYKIHETATPLMSRPTNESGKQIGWRVETKNFTYDAVVQPDKTINIYIEWGDDMGSDMTNFENWTDVEGHLFGLLKASV